MTDHAQTTEWTAEQLLAVVEAFMDGEPVDAAALRQALDRPDARDHLVDLLVLRDAVGGMAPSEWTAPRRRSVPRRLGWSAAAAVIVSLTTGYLAGQRRERPPAGAGVETVIGAVGNPAAPPPTRVIALRPGVDWIERAGGE